MIEQFVKRYFVEGDILIRLPGGVDVLCGAKSRSDAPVVVRVATAEAGLRIARNPDLALGEAFMDGDVVLERGSLYDLLEIITRNFRHHRRTGAWSRIKTAIAKQIAYANPRAASQRNVAHHYDLSVDLYRRFLDADLQYSCAYFPYPGASLEEAQAAKKRHIAGKLLIEPGARVLDIGCGWGGLGLTLAGDFGAKVDGVTLSKEQLATAQARAAERGLAERARFELRDYRDVRERYDRVVSVGMLEHVGAPNFQAYFDTVARLLKDDGVALVHTIGRADGPGMTSAWTAKYIFPGGYIPALSELAPAIERAGFVISDIEVLRIHYADTLRAWRERFMAHREEIARLYDERFCRMWEFYLAGSEASFRVGSSVVYQFQLAKRLDVVPIRRDYITDFDRRDAKISQKTGAP